MIGVLRKVEFFMVKGYKALDSCMSTIHTKIATQAHSFRCGLVAQQYKLFNKLNYIFNFTLKIHTFVTKSKKPGNRCEKIL